MNASKYSRNESVIDNSSQKKKDSNGILLVDKSPKFSCDSLRV